MEVVEEPLGGGGKELSAVHVICEDAVGVAQHPGVPVHPGGELVAGVVAGSREGEARGKPARTLLQPLDAEQFGAKRAFTPGGAARTEEAAQRVHHASTSPRCNRMS